MPKRLTEADYLAAARVVRKVYGLKRQPTRREVVAEVAMLRRKDRTGALDDFSLPYYVRLGRAVPSLNFKP